MKNYKTISVISVLLWCMCFNTGFASATQLPQEITDFIKEKYPEAGIRFDGLVELPDHTSYLPVMPLIYKKSEEPAKVVQTIPADTDFKQKPDMLLFSNNLALLKILKINDELTVKYSGDIPLSVKLGILPQDLIVPHGLILPTELKVILGNLKIPLKPKKDQDDIVFFGDTYEKNEKKVNLINENENDSVICPELKCLKNKVLYTSTFKENFINIINSQTGRITGNLKLPSNPSDMVLTENGRYLLVSSMSTNKIFIIDTYNNSLVKDIESGKLPSSILIPKGSDKAYTANKLSSTVSIIGLTDMALKKTLKVNGSPDNLAFLNENIYYNDTDSGNVYALNPDDEISTLITNVKNISAMKIYKNHLLMLSRSEGELVVFDLNENKELARIKIGEKPTDIQLSEKKGEIYVLSAGSDELNIIDLKEFKIQKTVSLNSGGFPGKIILIENENKALITNNDSYQIAVFDMKKQEIIGHMPISKNVSFLQISK